MRRPLSGAEQYLHAMDSDTPVSFATTACVRGSFSADNLRGALNEVQRRHRLLAVRSEMGDHGQAWLVSEGVPDIPIRVVEARDDEDWVRVLAEELPRPFAWEVGPLVRLALVSEPSRAHLVLTCHHAIADGLSGAFALRDLLRVLGTPSEHLEPLPDLPPIEAAVPPDVHKAVIKRLLRERKAAGSLPEPMPSALEAPAPSSEPPRFTIRAWIVPRNLTQTLIARARAEGTTVHGALSAAWMLAFAEQEASETPPVQSLQSPVNLRPYLSIPTGESFGLFISFVRAELQSKRPSAFWALARDIRDGFTRGMGAEDLFGIYSALRFFNAIPGFDFRALHRRLQPTEHAAQSLSLSNMGQLAWQTTYGQLVLEALWGPTFSALSQERVVGVTTFDGRMHLTFICREAILGRDAATCLQERFVDHLSRALE